jgi:hypothetical protein
MVARNGHSGVGSFQARHTQTSARGVRVNLGEQQTKDSMTIKALVMSDRSDEYTGKKGLVKQQIITVMDRAKRANDWGSPSNTP